MNQEYEKRLRQCVSYIPQPLKFQDCMKFGASCDGPYLLKPVDTPPIVVNYPFPNGRVPVSETLEFYSSSFNQGPLISRSEVRDAENQRVYDLSSGYMNKCCENCGYHQLDFNCI